MITLFSILGKNRYKITEGQELCTKMRNVKQKLYNLAAIDHLPQLLNSEYV